MHDAVFLEFTFGLRAGGSGSDFTLVPQNLPLGRLDEPVQARFSIPHRHRDLPRPHFQGQVRLLRKQPLQLRRLVFSPVVLGDDPIESLNLPAGRILPRGQAHIFSTGGGTVANKFCCSLTTDCPMQLVLHRGKNRQVVCAVTSQSRNVA